MKQLEKDAKKSCKEGTPAGHNNEPAEDFKAKAIKADGEIRRDFDELKSDWVALAKRIEAFRDAGYHRAIVDPKSGKPFRRFDDWAKSVFGKSPSTIFSYVAIIKELGPRVPAEELGKMIRQNAGVLAKASKQGKDVQPLVKPAQSFPHREFAHQVGIASEPEIATKDYENVGPFRVSRETKALLEEALRRARLEEIGKNGIGPDDMAIRLIARTYLEQQRTEIRKKPAQPAPGLEPVAMVAVA